MAVSVKVEPIDRTVQLQLTAGLGPQGRAAIARDLIAETSEINRQILGRIPPIRIFVDGREGAPLEAVREDGVIVGRYELVDETLRWIGEQLETHSPVGKPPKDPHPGLYRRSHSLFADGIEVLPGDVIPPAQEYVFINSVPYARKIERGQSSQAPDGVYQVVAVLARRRFGNVAKITYSFRTAIGGRFVGGRAGNRAAERNPAIIVRVK